MSKIPDQYRGTKEYLLVYSLLISAAQHRGIITYKDVAKIMGLPLTGQDMGQKTGRLLGEISKEEERNHRPMLSAIAVGYGARPGKGFFGLAEELGRLEEHANRQAREAFWTAECKTVYDAWAEDFKTYKPRER